MAINVSVQYNGGLLPDIKLLTLCDFIGEPFDTMKSFCPYSQCSHLNVLTIFRWILRRSRCIQNFLKNRGKSTRGTWIQYNLVML